MSAVFVFGRLLAQGEEWLAHVCCRLLAQEWLAGVCCRLLAQEEQWLADVEASIVSKDVRSILLNKEKEEQIQRVGYFIGFLLSTGYLKALHPLLKQTQFFQSV